MAKYFPENQVNNALAIMTVESHGDALAHGDKTLICKAGAEKLKDCWLHRYGDSSGLFQIRYMSGDTTRQKTIDPETNVRIASQMFKNRGWQPWTCSASKLRLGPRIKACPPK